MWNGRGLVSSARAVGRRVSRVGLVLALVGAAGPSAAITIETISEWNGTNDIGRFGEFNTATYGQTIIAPAGALTLDSYTFLLNDLLDPGFTDFQAVVFEWDPGLFRATGAALFLGSGVSTTNNGGAGGFESFTFATGSIPVTAGNAYVLGITASFLFDGTQGTSDIATVNSESGGPTSGVSGGQFVFMNNANNFGQLTTLPWSQRAGDTAFSATFGTSLVPEPTTGLLFGFGILGLAGSRRR